MSRTGISTLWGKFIVLIAVCGWCLPGQAKYSGGSGEPNDPYQIATPENLNDIGNHTEDWDKHFILVNDVNLAQYTGAQFKIIGNSVTKFTGAFDGNDNKVRNFTWIYSSKTYIGLFGYVGEGGQIRNLGMEDVNLSVLDGDCIGGLVGENHGTITNCYCTGSVYGYRDVGGLVGENRGGIKTCYSTSRVLGAQTIGGIVGYNSGTGTIDACYSSGSASSGYSAAGGLVGQNRGRITNCYSLASVSGDEAVGGLVGENRWSTIINCYSAGCVTGDWYVGGLIGLGGGVVNSFWDIETSSQLASAGGRGKTTAEMKMGGTYFGWGGCGNEGVWTIDEGNDYSRLAWEGRSGKPIPGQQLSGLIPGSGTENDPYMISTSEQLNLIGIFPCEWDKYFMLVDDINFVDYNRTSYNIIGSRLAAFTGVFDGNEHKILDFTWRSTGQSYIGLFGFVEGDGQVKNLGLENVDVNAISGQYVGGLVGGNWSGKITNCYCGGNVRGHDSVGGLVGSNSNGWNPDAMISGCCSSASVSGTDYYVGGLVGQNFGIISSCCSTGSVCGGDFDIGGLVGTNSRTIYDCHSSASVSGSSSVGGLVGQNSGAGTLTACYATGPVSGGYGTGGLLGYNSGTVIASFWDVNTSGRTTSDGGTPKTTAEMKTQGTFISAKWDFVGETANGTEDVWTICEGTNYPRFVYQIPQGDIVCPDGVNALDFSALARYWHETGCAALDDCDGADIDLSGAVDFGDVAAVAESWLRDVR